MEKSRVNEIDFLRFFAAIAVVFYHYSFRGYAADSMSVMPYATLTQISKYGYLGVDLFFIISGFVILMTASSGSLKKFVISRVVRLYPAFWVCCTITFVVTLLIGGDRYSASFFQYMVNMTMLNGFVGVPSIDGAYWSLFVEMRFYAMVAMLLLIRKIQYAQQFLVAWIFVSILLLFFPVYKLQYIFITDYSAYFIAGSSFYLIWAEGPSLVRFGLVGLSLVLAIFKSIQRLPHFEEHYKVVMSGSVVGIVVTIFFLVMFLVALRKTSSWGNMRWLFLGSLTYPLYLLHQNVGFMVFNIAYPAVNAHVIFWTTIVVAIILSAGIHFFFERKMATFIKVKLTAITLIM